VARSWSSVLASVERCDPVADQLEADGKHQDSKAGEEGLPPRAGDDFGLTAGDHRAPLDGIRLDAHPTKPSAAMFPHTHAALIEA